MAALDWPIIVPEWLFSPNYSPWRPGSPVAIVLHTEAGTQNATRAWFSSPSSQVSAHFAASLAGELVQFVDLEHQAWSNGILEPGARWARLGLPGNPNGWTVSIETEDLGNPDQVVTPREWGAVVAAVRLSLQRYPGIAYLARHSDISPRSRPNCPGTRWTASSRFGALAALFGLETL